MTAAEEAVNPRRFTMPLRLSLFVTLKYTRGPAPRMYGSVQSG